MPVADVWEKIRVLWVTGEQQQAMIMLRQQNRNAMLRIILAAISDYWRSCDNHVHNGALTDLTEIIVAITRGYTYD